MLKEIKEFLKKPTIQKTLGCHSAPQVYHSFSSIVPAPKFSVVFPTPPFWFVIDMILAIQ